MSESYQVVFTGELQTGMDAEQVIDRFSEKFKLERPKAEKVVSGGRPVVLKKGLDQQTAEKYQKVLQAIGMMVALAPKPGSTEVVTEAPQPPETSEAPEAAETPAVAEAPASSIPTGRPALSTTGRLSHLCSLSSRRPSVAKRSSTGVNAAAMRKFTNTE